MLWPSLRRTREPSCLQPRRHRTSAAGYDGGLCPARARHLVSAGAARQRRAGRDRRRHPRQPGRDRRRRDRLGQDDAAAEDLPRARPHAHRAHPAAPASPPARSPSASPRSCRSQLGTLVGYKVRFTDKVVRRHAHRADDRRHPAQRDPPRPAAAPLRHDHHRRGARAHAQRRLPARLPARASCPSAPTSRSIVTSRDDRPRELRRDTSPTPTGEARARSSRCPAAPIPVEIRYRPLVDEDRRRRRRRRRGDEEPTTWQGIVGGAARARPRGAGRRARVPPRRGRDPRRRGCRARRVRERTRSPTEVLPLYGRLSAAEQHRVFERSRRSPACAAASCSPRTSPRRASRCPASAT